MSYEGIDFFLIEKKWLIESVNNFFFRYYINLIQFTP